jgi:hypothetical protein
MVQGESYCPICNQSLTLGQVVQYKEQEDSDSTLDDESSFLREGSFRSFLQKHKKYQTKDAQISI